MRASSALTCASVGNGNLCSTNLRYAKSIVFIGDLGHGDPIDYSIPGKRRKEFRGPGGDLHSLGLSHGSSVERSLFMIRLNQPTWLWALSIILLLLGVF